MRRDVFQAIADPVRREIIHLLGDRSMTVNEVAQQFEISRQAISKQLKILNECGIVRVDQKGRERYFMVEAQNLIPAFLWLDQFRQQWEERIDAFDEYLQALKSKKNE